MAPNERTIGGTTDQRSLQILYKHRNRAIEKINAGLALTYLNEERAKVRILDVVINEVRNH